MKRFVILLFLLAAFVLPSISFAGGSVTGWNAEACGVVLAAPRSDEHEQIIIDENIGLYEGTTLNFDVYPQPSFVAERLGEEYYPDGFGSGWTAYAVCAHVGNSPTQFAYFEAVGFIAHLSALNFNGKGSPFKVRIYGVKQHPVYGGTPGQLVGFDNPIVTIYPNTKDEGGTGIVAGIALSPGGTEYELRESQDKESKE